MNEQAWKSKVTDERDMEGEMEVAPLGFEQRITTTLQFVECVLGAGGRQVRQLIQTLLFLAYIPVQALGQRVKPIGYLIL